MNFPDLSEPHASALREAVSFILETFTPIGIVAAGTILRGDADANSDIDLYVVHLTLKRQRLSRIYNGVPVEIFVNPPQAIRRYFESEARDGQPYTSHMLATGTVLLGESNKEFQGLLDDASRVLSHRPTPSDKLLTRERYAIATQFEDAEDIREKDGENALVILNGAVHRALRYVFHKRGVWLPRKKRLLAEIEAFEPQLGTLARAYYQSSTLNDRFNTAREIVMGTAGADRLFEWESEQEEVSP